MVNKPTLCLVLYIWPQDPQGQLWSDSLMKGTLVCKLIGNIISTYSRMPYRVVGGNVIQCPLVLPYQWGCFVQPVELSKLPDYQSKY